MTQQKGKDQSPLRIQLNNDWDSTFQLMSWWDVEIVRSAKIMVVGAGALGNEVLKNLALLNVGHIIIVDYDQVEYSNLSRSILFRAEDALEKRFKVEVAAKRLVEINPNIKVTPIVGDIMSDVGLGLFARMDVVIGCLDNRLARLWINQACQKVNKIWIDGAIENLSGQVNVFKPGISCYASNLNEVDWEQIDARISCYTLAQRNAAQGRIPTTPISSSIIAAMQVQEALKVVHHNDDRLLAERGFYYDGRNNIAMMLKTKPVDEELCEIPIIKLLKANSLSQESTVKDLLDYVAVWVNEPNFTIHLGFDLVLGLANVQTDESRELFAVRHKIPDEAIKDLQTSPADEIRITNFIKAIDRFTPYGNVKLKDFGFPPLHIIGVQTFDEEFYLEISGDEKRLQLNEPEISTE